MSKTIETTRNLTDDEIEQFEFLDSLRDSGETNMFGSPSYLVNEYGMDKIEARRVVSLWMHNCDEDYKSLKVDIE